MRFDHLKSLYLSAGVFVIFLISGFFLSQHKVLWLDELYTQKVVIDADSYAGILLLKFPEGNKNPLFYIIQKTVCEIFSFRMPDPDPVGMNIKRYIPAQIILRIPANFYMSLALALIFYFFTRFYSVFAALYALSVALVSPMVWLFWAEARPYPLWFLLTTVQLLLLCSAYIAPKIRTAKGLMVTHLLLALTTPASIFQITIVTLAGWWKEKYSLKQLILVWALPMGIAFLYYHFALIFSIKTYYFFSNLFDAVMPERLFVYVIYGLIAWVLPKKYKQSSLNIFFMPVFLLFLASGVLLLAVHLFYDNADYGFFSRYLIYLTPPDIIMFSLASIDLRRWSRSNPWVCLNVSIILGGLVIIRGLMTYRTIMAAATYAHSPG